MAVCLYCGGSHVWWDCRKKPEGWKPPKESTAARKDEPTPELGRPMQGAGTQAPPVGTPKPPRKGNRHRPGYHAEYMRKRRAAQKAAKEPK